MGRLRRGADFFSCISRGSRLDSQCSGRAGRRCGFAEFGPRYSGEDERHIESAETAGRYELENTNSSGSHLPESDSADMDVFLARMEQLLPVLGQDFLKPISKPQKEAVKSDLLYCEIKNVRATGKQTENGFVVLMDSEAVLDVRPSTQKYPYAATLRTQLLSEGVLEKSKDRLIFKKDYEFSSPSAAASVIHGGHANGLREWKDSKGIPLKDKEEKELSNHRVEQIATSASVTAPLDS